VVTVEEGQALIDLHENVFMVEEASAKTSKNVDEGLLAFVEEIMKSIIADEEEEGAFVDLDEDQGSGTLDIEDDRANKSKSCFYNSPCSCG